MKAILVLLAVIAAVTLAACESQRLAQCDPTPRTEGRLTKKRRRPFSRLGGLIPADRWLRRRHLNPGRVRLNVVIFPSRVALRNASD
jgi:hypothetical protein